MISAGLVILFMQTVTRLSMRERWIYSGLMEFSPDALFCSDVSITTANSEAWNLELKVDLWRFGHGWYDVGLILFCKLSVRKAKTAFLL